MNQRHLELRQQGWFPCSNIWGVSVWLSLTRVWIREAERRISALGMNEWPKRVDLFPFPGAHVACSSDPSLCPIGSHVFGAYHQ
ncbi:hypothetical protein RRG08_064718 [Elysia crispata]|uniref:Uncharacterized protein n=1 Tax=Elysia crispata TaxID=231223 RepID=A0AAE0Z1C9_9GAST|nr:hypothetical protein RRG08_064718 [Elysia crispata]